MAVEMAKLSLWLITLRRDRPFTFLDHAQIETKLRLHAEAEAATVRIKAIADDLIAFELRGLDGDAYEEQRAADQGMAPHPGGVTDGSRGSQRSEDPRNPASNAPHPGGVTVPASQTPVAPLRGADLTTSGSGGVASLNPRLPSGSPPGWSAARPSPLSARHPLLATHALEPSQLCCSWGHPWGLFARYESVHV